MNNTDYTYFLISEITFYIKGQLSILKNNELKDSVKLSMLSDLLGTFSRNVTEKTIEWQDENK